MTASIMLDPKSVTQQQEIFTEEWGFTRGIRSWLSIASRVPSRDTSSSENKRLQGLYLVYAPCSKCPVVASCTPD
jgi:hypothetical protein